MTSDGDDLTLTSDTLERLAIEEQFLREWSAGMRPRLSVYALRYPAHAEALALLVANLPPDAEHPTERVETLPESFPERLWNGAGVARALTSAFDDLPTQPAWPTRAPLPRVAEERSLYEATQTDDPIAPESTPERASDD